MQLERQYPSVNFPVEVVREASNVLFEGLESLRSGIMSVQIGDEEWTQDSEEEFFADHRRALGGHSFRSYYQQGLADHNLIVVTSEDHARVVVRSPTRPRILETFNTFERNLEASRLPESEPRKETLPPPVVFIGHGRSVIWRDLKDHLHEQHEYEVEAYDIGARAGHAVRDILEGMLRKSSFALLVMTGEDETADGALRARQNVVHEAGLFQGRLGFDRAIVLLEDGVEAFSNIDGIHQIRFSRGNIRETFGDVLATVHREFGTQRR